METKYNLKSPGVKRLMREALELAEPTEEYSATPLEDNLFEWHFTVRGPPNTEFQGGIYHGRILLPSQYPMKPPDIILLTPNGRFETNKKICLSISGHHPESWQPSWSIRTALLALIAFMPTKPGGTIGSLDYSVEERQLLAKKSQGWECAVCGKINTKLSGTSATPLTQEETNLLKQIAFKAEEDAAKVKKVEETNIAVRDNLSDNVEALRHRTSTTDVRASEEVIDPLLRASVESTNRYIRQRSYGIRVNSPIFDASSWCHGDDAAAGYSSARLQHVESAILVLLVGLGISVVFAIGECIWNGYVHRKSRRGELLQK